MLSSDEFPSHDLVFEWTRTAPEEIGRDISTTDSKASGLFSSGSVIIGVVVALVNDIILDWTVAPLVLAIVCFAGLSWWSWSVLRARLVPIAPNPLAINDKLAALPPAEAKRKRWEAVLQDYEYVMSIVEAKGKAVRLAVPALFLEVVFLLIWLFLLGVLR